MDQSQEPKLIRKIGFGYAVDLMPADLVLGYHQLSKKFEQAKFDIKVSLVPVHEIPPDLDLLFIPRELARQAAQVISTECIIALDEFVNQSVFAELVQRLEEGTEIRALRAEAAENRSEGVTMHYRGYERMD